MNAKTPRDLLGDPNDWKNHISDDVDWMPDMEEATILDVFVAGNEVAIYTQNARGIEALSTFLVDDKDLRDRVANALVPGSNLHEALTRPI